MLGHAFYGDFKTTTLAPASVDATVARDPPQPEGHVRCRLQIPEFSKQFEKDVLRQVFRNCPIAHDVVGHAKHHGLMLPHERGEGCLIARLRPRKHFIGP